MDEHAARDVVLMRAIETGDDAGSLLSADDRRYAGRAAAELVRWQGAEQRSAPTAEQFLSKRAELALDKAAARSNVVQALRRSRWRPWIGVALPIAALALGALTEQVTDRRHINVLAFPLLAIVAWNLVVYLLLLVQPLLGGRVRGIGPLRRWLAGAIPERTPVRTPQANARGDGTAAIAARFAVDWSTLSAPLLQARAGRVLHLAAAAFATGALLGLYLRALAFEYRVGWESTFLSASAVHGFLATLLAPAARLLGTPIPPVEAIEAMRVVNGVGGADAGPWIHLYAVTLGIAVILPRLLLAAWSGWRERGLARALVPDLGTPYFRRVLAGFAPAAVRVRVIPYSYTLSETAVAGLGALARHLLGDACQLALRPSVEFGSERSAADGLTRREDDVPLTLAVFNAAATPENENHGLFLDTLRAALDTTLAVAIDVGPYRARLGTQAGAAERIEQRLHAWQSFAAQRGLAAVCLDLAEPDLAAAESSLAPALAAD